MPTQSTLPPLRVEEMTSRQLVRRARLIETVIELMNERGGSAAATTMQMREVAERSGVALGTVYRYFRSKEHLLAASIVEWQQKLTRRIASRSEAAAADPPALVRTYLRRALQAFHKSPAMAALMVQMLASTDPDVVEALENMGSNNVAMWQRLLVTVPAVDAPHVRLALDAVLMSSVTSMITGRCTLEQAIENIEGVTDLLLPRT